MYIRTLLYLSILPQIASEATLGQCKEAKLKNTSGKEQNNQSLMQGLGFCSPKGPEILVLS